MSHTKDFDAWNQDKKRIEAQPQSSLYIKTREVWWTSVGVNVGTEIDGKNNNFERPVMILRKLGREQFIGIPLTSRSKHGVFYLPVSYSGNNGTACISQIRVLNTKRLLRKIGRVQLSDFQNICNSISQLITTGRI